MPWRKWLTSVPLSILIKPWTSRFSMTVICSLWRATYLNSHNHSVSIAAFFLLLSSAWQCGQGSGIACEHWGTILDHPHCFFCLMKTYAYVNIKAFKRISYTSLILNVLQRNLSIFWSSHLWLLWRFNVVWITGVLTIISLSIFKKALYHRVYVSPWFAVWPHSSMKHPT